MGIPILSDTVKYIRLALGLRGFLGSHITLEESRHVISTRLRRREKNFLSLVQKGIYENPKSPYLKLLNIAGCEFKDIETSVSKEGIEGTLSILLSKGVYLGWDEFKGKKDIVRGSSRIQFEDTDLDNPFLPGYFYVQSSGTRSAGTRTMFDLENLMEKVYYRLPMLAVNNAMDFPMGLWLPILPSIAGMSAVLENWKVGKPVVKWFSPVSESQVGAILRDKLAMRYIIYGGRLCGAKLVKPEYVSLTDAIQVAQWMADTKKQFGGCSLSCFVGSAVKVCQVAIDNGLDIAGTHFFVGGEPLSEAKRQQIEASGALVTTRYWITEIGFIGCGCSRTEAIDDVHLFHDGVAVIQHQRKVELAEVDVNAFLFTSLLPSTPKVLLNVESDDYGDVGTRNCGCLFQEIGFNQHLYNIRSFAKLTGSGMTIMGSDFVRILEEVLPRKYGGTATDYQLVEEEDTQGNTFLSLIISPDVGDVDETDVINTVLSELRKGVYGGRLAAGFWSQVKMLRIKRIYPISSSGKITTLHLMKKQ